MESSEAFIVGTLHDIATLVKRTRASRSVRTVFFSFFFFFFFFIVSCRELRLRRKTAIAILRLTFYFAGSPCGFKTVRRYVPPLAISPLVAENKKYRNIIKLAFVYSLT